MPRIVNLCSTREPNACDTCEHYWNEYPCLHTPLPDLTDDELMEVARSTGYTKDCIEYGRAVVNAVGGK